MTVVIENTGAERKVKEYKDVTSVSTQQMQTYMYVLKFKDGSEITVPSEHVIISKED
ncbi:hypothetical protein [Ruminococcus sp.]|uniref:hypothetical protein n=1 Tax=Ruminococcus sp. TaxID=41978 RepID=UPI001B74771B|nr:hypothetical protein [Ruminococcus sp.]MBP5433763.1 hypothetical protein [Ruminococcus sp.]